jgi:hypothetical protein
MRRLAAIAVATAVRPGLAEACASCISSPYGDRTFNWAFAILLSMPFIVGTAIGGVFFLLFRRRRARPTLPIEETT